MFNCNDCLWQYLRETTIDISRKLILIIYQVLWYNPHQFLRHRSPRCVLYRFCLCPAWCCVATRTPPGWRQSPQATTWWVGMLSAPYRRPSQAPWWLGLQAEGGTSPYSHCKGSRDCFPVWRGSVRSTGTNGPVYFMELRECYLFRYCDSYRQYNFKNLIGLLNYNF